jgi:type I restriction-modification system DNA methylase subunit
MISDEVSIEFMTFTTGGRKKTTFTLPRIKPNTLPDEFLDNIKCVRVKDLRTICNEWKIKGDISISKMKHELLIVAIRNNFEKGSDEEKEVEDKPKKTKIKTNKKNIKTIVEIKSEYDDESEDDDESDNDDESDEKNKRSTISNKEALKDKIHSIHNYLRNNGAGYGMNALKVFNIIYGLKKIEEHGLNSIFKSDDDPNSEIYKFSDLLEIAKKADEEKLEDIIINTVLNSLHSNTKTKELLFYEIPRNIRGKVFSHIIKEIDSISEIEKSCNVLLSGKVYEYFIGRDETAISELGAYFTDRHIVDYTMKKLNPSINPDGTISSMIDMFGGSGGFTTGYINFLKEKDLDAKINWKTEVNKVFHFDMNEDVIKSAGLEILCLTGELPNMSSNLKYKNSFNDEFNNEKYKYPITNPPYGGDKIKKSNAKHKRDKMKEYIKSELLTMTSKTKIEKRHKQLKDIELKDKIEKKNSIKSTVCLDTCSNRINRFAIQNGTGGIKKKLKGTDKESCSLMLLMDIVEVGGTAIGVLKEGVFFASAYKELRKCLIQKYNVREVISIPSDQFENTSTKTSILIFDNLEDKKTTSVKFRDLIVERYEEDKFVEINGEIVLIENKGDIRGVSDILVSEATCDEILGNKNYSLNGKEYKKKVTKVGFGYDLVKLGDISKFLQKSKRKASDGELKGKYNFYTSSEKIKKCDTADYNQECLIIGSGGIANIKMDNKFSCSADNLLITSDKNYYIYYLIIGNMSLLSDGFTGSVLKHLSKDYLINLQIPIPKKEEKIKEWVKRISDPYNEKNEKKNQIKKLEVFIQDRIKEIGETEECEDVELESVCKILPGVKHCTNISKKKGKYKFYNSSKESNLFVDFCEIKEESIIIGQGGIINIHYDTNFTPSKHVAVLQSINKDYNELKYYYRLIKNLLNNFTTNGSVINWLNKENIKKFKISIPTNKKLIQDLEPTFQQIEILQSEVKIAEELYKKLIQDLNDEAIPKIKY